MVGRCEVRSTWQRRRERARDAGLRAVLVEPDHPRRGHVRRLDGQQSRCLPRHQAFTTGIVDVPPAQDQPPRRLARSAADLDQVDRRRQAAAQPAHATRSGSRRRPPARPNATPVPRAACTPRSTSARVWQTDRRMAADGRSPNPSDVPGSDGGRLVGSDVATPGRARRVPGPPAAGRPDRAQGDGAHAVAGRADVRRRVPRMGAARCRRGQVRPEGGRDPGRGRPHGLPARPGRRADPVPRRARRDPDRPRPSRLGARPEPVLRAGH